MSTFGSIAMSTLMSVPGPTQISATPGAAVTLAINTGTTFNFAVWTAGEAETVNLTGSQTAGQELTLMVTNDATLPRVITLGTGFRTLGTITGVASKVSVLKCISNGTSMIEVARSVAIT